MQLRPLAALAITLMVALVAPHARAVDQASPPNAADLYRKAMQWWFENSQGESRTLTDDELGELADGVSGSLTPTQRSGYEKIKPYLNMMREAAGTQNCDFQLDYSQGFELLLPQLSQMRNAARVLRLDAQARMIDGDSAGALEDLRAINGLSQHSRGDKITISSLVSGAMLMLNDNVIDEALGRGAIDSARAATLLEDLDRFKGSDPLNLGDAIRNEAPMAASSVEKLLRDDNGLSKLSEFIGGNDEVKAKLEKETPESIRAELTQYTDLMNKAAAAVTNPNREAGQAQLADIEAHIEAGDYGALAQALSPSLSKLAATNARILDMLAARRALLEELRDGKKTPESLANAAYAYFRLASLFNGMPDEAQRDLEAARVAGNALEPDALEHARQLIAPLREQMQREFRIASKCGRCDFQKRLTNGGSFIPWYLPALRGATRVAMTDAMLGPSPVGPDGRVRGSDLAPAKAAETIGWSVALARHLGGDPALGHALVASSVLNEAGAALDEASRRNLVAEGERTTLREQLAQLSPADPTGLHKAVERERGLIVNWLSSFDTHVDRAELSKSLERRENSAVAGMLLVLDVIHRNEPEAMFDARYGASALVLPLNGIGDLVAPASVEAAKEVAAHVTTESIEGAKSTQQLLALYALPTPPSDFALAEIRASSALARLLDLVKDRATPAGPTPAAAH